MKKSTLVLFCFFCAIANLYSQTKKESVLELCKVMQLDSTIGKSIDALMPAMLSRMPQAKDASQQMEMDKKIKSIVSSVKEMTEEFVKLDLVEIYEKHFTEADIQELIQFYKTPIGQKLIKETPELQKDIMTRMMQNFLPKMQQKMSAGLKTK